MNMLSKKSRLYLFFSAVVTVLSFAVCLYLFIICFAGTYRKISDIGSDRILFLNSIVVLLIAVFAFLGAGVYLYKTQRLNGIFIKFEDENRFLRVKNILKILIFIECIVLAAVIFGIRQRVDQYSVQYSAYGLSWGVAEVLNPPRHLGVYPNNIGFVLALYFLSFITGHYNNAVIMLFFSVLVPFIYSDLADIGGKFGLTRKSQIMIMICGLVFLPLQTKVTFIYGDIPGLFFAVRAMKHAADIAQNKSSIKKVITVVAFIAAAYAFKNNFLIFAIAIALYLFVELLRNRRFKELYIPFAVLAAPVLLNYCLKIIVGAIVGGNVSTGASKFSWIAMGMQEPAGTFNGYNDATYFEAGYDVNLQTEWSKNAISERLSYFIQNPNQALGFYIRKIMVQWSDPTFSTFDFCSRNVYLYNSASPLVWFISGPAVISAVSSVLKIFQVLMFLGGGVFSIREMKRKAGTPALLLFITFIGGYFFHILWEASSSYAVPYFVVLIPLGVAGISESVKRISEIMIQSGLMKNKTISVSVSGMAFFIAGTTSFLLAAAGIGTIRQMLIDGQNEYRTYFAEDICRTRNPVEAGCYMLKPAVEGYDGEGFEIELDRYAGKYRMRINVDSVEEELYLTNDRGQVKVDWCSYDETQVFVILKNTNGTYSICQGMDNAFVYDSEKGIRVEEFTDYTYVFDSSEYSEFIAEHPEMTWELVPVS